MVSIHSHLWGTAGDALAHHQGCGVETVPMSLPGSVEMARGHRGHSGHARVLPSVPGDGWGSQWSEWPGHSHSQCPREWTVAQWLHYGDYATVPLGIPGLGGWQVSVLESLLISLGFGSWSVS